MPHVATLSILTTFGITPPAFVISTIAPGPNTLSLTYFALYTDALYVVVPPNSTGSNIKVGLINPSLLIFHSISITVVLAVRIANGFL